MTEKHLPLSSPNVVPSQTIYPLNISTKQDVLPNAEPAGDEDYTIDCICGFNDDDGATVYCDDCQTWQHIECFYPNNAQDAARDDFDHRCHRCKPRPLDIQQAIERQRARVNMAVKHEQQALTQKVKRPASKSHKKKAKPTDLQPNGHGAGADTKQSQDLPPPAKKAKNSHKPSQSISSTKRSPSNGASRTNHHPPSPAKTPPDLPDDFELYTPSNNFLAMCSEQDVKDDVHMNSYASLSVPSTLGSWVRDPQRLQNESGHRAEDVFQRLPTDIEARQRPLKVESKRISPSTDKEIQWKYLVAPTAVNKDVPLMPLNGVIGFQKEYCEVPEHRWDAMTCPMPFVFFHPMLPLYIDTRREGSQARYVRQSCDPNASLDTFLKNDSEYQFWLVSEKPIAANEQVTLPWDIRFPRDGGERWLRLLGLREDKTAGLDDDIGPEEYESIDSWLRIVLAEYGGCACDLGANCAFARFHRNYIGKTISRSNAPNPPKKKNARKTKAQAISPTSTGPATNSRAPSEGQHDETHDHDSMSTSGSRSKPPSRDLTPARQGSFDTLGILTEPTDRDKRKVAMVEDSFRRLEQQAPRKKKPRLSDGTGTGTSTGAGHPGTATNSKKGRNSTSQASGQSKYVDAATSGSKPGSKSGSPTAAMSSTLTKPAVSKNASRAGSTKQTSRHASVAGALYPTRPHYRDAGSQTDFPGYDGLLMHPSHFVKRPHRRIVSLNKKIFENNRNMRAEIARREKLEAENAAQQAAAQQLVPTSMEVDVIINHPLPTPQTTAPTCQQSMPAFIEDAPMADAPSSSPIIPKPAPISTTGVPSLGSLKTKSPELRVQLPPVPAFNSTTAVSATTPMSASPIVQSPFGAALISPFGPPAVNGIANPSPVKKKLSLSDYTKNRKAAAASKPSVRTNLKPSANNVDDPKSASSVEMVVGSPIVEKPADTATSGSTTTTTAPVNSAL